MTMNAAIPRRPIRDEELERFWQVVDEARQARITRADFQVPVVDQGRDVLVYCFNPGGAPGKRYRYEPGWIEAFRHDLRDCLFLAA